MSDASDDYPVHLPVPPTPPAELEDLAALREYFAALAIYQRFVNPPLERYPVASSDPLHDMMFLELERVCLVTTTKGKASREGELRWLTSNGESFYSSHGLADVERDLCFPRADTKNGFDDSKAGNPWFVRCHGSYLVNVRKVRAFDYAGGAVTIWVDGHEEAFEKAVSETYGYLFRPHFVGIREK